MRWGIRKQHQIQTQHPQDRERQSKHKTKSKNMALYFSPLSWLSKLTAKPSATTKPKPTPTPTVNTTTFRSRVTRCTTMSPVIAPAQRHYSPAAADVIPRRLSVRNDNADAGAVRRHYCRRGHHSLGGDHDLPPLGHLIPFSLAATPQARPPQKAAAPSDASLPRRCRRRRRGGSRRSFSGRMPTRVRVRSPRRVPAVHELERFAVVRRTRDPQRDFRESMVEMIANKGIGERPEELERLLACYLSLNADEHHDCIVKVFRQVWFEYVNQPRPARQASTA